MSQVQFNLHLGFSRREPVNFMPSCWIGEYWWHYHRGEGRRGVHMPWSTEQSLLVRFMLQGFRQIPPSRNPRFREWTYIPLPAETEFFVLVIVHVWINLPYKSAKSHTFSVLSPLLRQCGTVLGCRAEPRSNEYAGSRSLHAFGFADASPARARKTRPSTVLHFCSRSLPALG